MYGMERFTIETRRCGRDGVPSREVQGRGGAMQVAETLMALEGIPPIKSH